MVKISSKHYGLSPKGFPSVKSNTESASISNCLLLETSSDVPASIVDKVSVVSSVVIYVE